MARYIIGIDLGTTTSALSYIDTTADNPEVKILPILQLEDAGKERETGHLPSFCYLPTKSEIKSGLFLTSFENPIKGEKPVAVGAIAKNRLTQNPHRVIHSAKSWFVHQNIDRKQKLLPWSSESITGGDKLSPVDVASRYLKHLRFCWNKSIAAADPSLDIIHQKITITVPASFDEVATSLTLEAATLAGFKKEHIRLLEEPQAAFYSWLDQQKPSGPRKIPSLQKSQRVLVCDIGGGTTDLCLFDVIEREGQEPKIERIAVSDHILLGGDNIDLKIADHLERKAIAGGHTKCSPEMWSNLVEQSRRLKEALLSKSDEMELHETHFVSIDSQSSNIFENQWSTETTAKELLEIILDGFFPKCSQNDKTEKSSESLAEWDLPYAHDSAFTRHIAEFLEGRPIDAILFAGGTLTPILLRERLTEVIGSWMQKRQPVVLENPSLSMSVAYGGSLAEYYRHKNGPQISGGYPRSLYLRVSETDAQHETVVCVLSKGHSGEAPNLIDQLSLYARTSQTVQFQLYSSVASKRCKVGQVYKLAEIRAARPLSPLQAVLSLNKGAKQLHQTIPVGLEIILTQTGILTIYCFTKGDDEPARTRWQLQFNVQENTLKKTGVSLTKEAPGNERKKSFIQDPNDSRSIPKIIDACYGRGHSKTEDDHSIPHPKELIKHLETITQESRLEWNLAHLRSLVPTVLKNKNRRGLSPDHEMSWLNLLGLSMRPGLGSAKDPGFIDQIWSIFSQGMQNPKNKAVEVQWWILWRRVCAGLSASQQEKIFQKIYPMVRQKDVRREILMLGSSLERVDAKRRAQLGNLICQGLGNGKPHGAGDRLWSLGRLASRKPIYGDLGSVLTPSVVEPWLKEVLAKPYPKNLEKSVVRLITQAGRVIGNRQLDLSQPTRATLKTKLQELRASDREIQLVEELVPFDREDTNALFGESLPEGLILKAAEAP